MRAIFAALVLVAPLAACEESNPTFGSGGWQDGDVPEAVAVDDEAEPEATTPAVRAESERPARRTGPAPEADVVEEAAAPPLAPAPARPPAPVVVDVPPVEPAAPSADPHAGHPMPTTPPATPPSGQ